jgi:hypothetical protein
MDPSINTNQSSIPVLSCPSENELLYNIQYGDNNYYDCLANALIQKNYILCGKDNEKIATGISLTIVFFVLILCFLIFWYVKKRRNH